MIVHFSSMSPKSPGLPGHRDENPILKSERFSSLISCIQHLIRNLNLSAKFEIRTSWNMYIRRGDPNEFYQKHPDLHGKSYTKSLEAPLHISYLKLRRSLEDLAIVFKIFNKLAFDSFLMETGTSSPALTTISFIYRKPTLAYGGILSLYQSS